MAKITGEEADDYFNIIDCTNGDEQSWLRKEAKDKPVHINCNAGSNIAMIVNQETGDIFVQDFSRYSEKGESTLTTLKFKKFMEVPGEKRAFRLDTGMRIGGLDYDMYSDKLQSEGIIPPTDGKPVLQFIEADINDKLRYELTKPSIDRANSPHSLVYEIDLRNPDNLIIYVPNLESPKGDFYQKLPHSPKTANVIEKIGNAKSTLPSEQEIKIEYDLRKKIAVDLLNTDTLRLLEHLDEYKEAGLNLKNVLDRDYNASIYAQFSQGNSSRSIDGSRNRPFDNDDLYKEDRRYLIKYLLDSVKNYSQKNNIPAKHVAELASDAAIQLGERLIDDKKQVSESVSSNLVSFIGELVDSCQGDERTEVIKALRPGFNVLLGNMLRTNQESIEIISLNATINPKSQNPSGSVDSVRTETLQKSHLKS